MPRTTNLIGKDCKLPELQAKIEELAGGMTLKELLNNGYLVNADGTPFLSPGQTLTPEADQKRYNEPEYDALMAAKEGGVFLFADRTTAFAKPHFIRGGEDSVTCTDKLSDKEVDGIIKDNIPEVKKPDRVKRPHIFNRIRNFFSKNGTPEMNSYNKYKADLKKYNEYAEKLKNTQDKVKGCAVSAAQKDAASVHTEKTFKQVVITGAELKDRYDRIKLNPCEVKEGEVSRAGDLLATTKRSLEPVAMGIMTKFIENKAKLNRGLASMAAVDLIIKERLANKREDGRIIPGPLEQKLNKDGEEKFIDFIADDPAFKNATKDMTSKKLDEFVSKNKVNELSKDVFKSIVGKVTGAKENGAEEKVLGNEKVNENVGEKVNDKPDDPSVGALGH